MIGTTIFLLALCLYMYYWYTNTHIKEQAFELAQVAVEKNGYQLLDDAIGLSQLRITRQGGRVAVMRTFEFHYADDQQQRHMGQVIRCGKGWLNIQFPSSASSHTVENSDRKIIPFPGTYQHD